MHTEVNPQLLYHRVWQLVKDEFYLPDYNKQSWDRWEHRRISPRLRNRSAEE